MPGSRTGFAAMLMASFLTAFSSTHAGDAALQFDGNPADSGMQADKLARIAPRMREFVDAKVISGAVTLVARKGRVVEFDAVGLADIASNRPMQKDTLFAVASMTKPIAATALMILRDEGKLSLDDAASKYIPSLKDVKLNKSGGRPAREITIRDLLTHTSGFSGAQRTEGTLAETADKIAARGLDFEPGTEWKYSPAISVCGRIVEVASGQPFDQFLEARIFRPLGMKDSTFNPTPEQKSRLATIYQPTDAGNGLEAGRNTIVESSGPVTPNPSGGLFSTAADMARFYQMILGGGTWNGQRIVSADSIKQMTSVHTGDLKAGFLPGTAWGLGWCIIREPEGVAQMVSPGTYGHGGAFGTQGWVDPKQETIYVLMIQRLKLPNSDGSEMRQAFQQLAADAIAK